MSRANQALSIATAAAAALILTASASAPADILLFTPEADTFVNESSADTNYGSDQNLEVDGWPDTKHTYIRFDVTGITGPVTAATLRLDCHDTGNDVEVYTSTDTTWSEFDPTWNSRISDSGSVLATLGTGSTGWRETSVLSAVTGDGLVTFVLKLGGMALDGADFHSKEHSNQPILAVEFTGSTPDPDPEPEDVPDVPEDTSVDTTPDIEDTTVDTTPIDTTPADTTPADTTPADVPVDTAPADTSDDTSPYHRYEGDGSCGCTLVH